MSDNKKFADTNVLVYAFDSSEPKKQNTAQNLLKNDGSQGRIILSTQVLQEFFVVVTHKLPINPLKSRFRQLLQIIWQQLYYLNPAFKIKECLF